MSNIDRIRHSPTPEPRFTPPDSHNPSPADTIIARSYLVGFGLPTELALYIIDLAEYYPVIRGHTCKKARASASQGENNSAAILYAVSEPIPECPDGVRVTPKGVKFTIRSHDQGYTGERGTGGTYNSSYTWFEASILRPSANDPVLPSLPYESHPKPKVNCLSSFHYDLVPSTTNPSPNEEACVWHIQSNLVAQNNEREHEVEWRAGNEQESGPGEGDGKGFLESLKQGDRVGVWARALFPAWINTVNEVAIEVVCVVD